MTPAPQRTLDFGPDQAPADLPVGLMLVHGNLAESLRDLLVTWIRVYPLAPLEQEMVLVQSNGNAQWLKLALAEDPEAGGCGIAAGLEFSLPSRFLWQAYRAVLGREAVPEVSPFDKPRLVWRLMRLLPEVMGEPLYAPLRRFLADDGDMRKRFQLAERLADLFDQYQVYRADWLAAWAEGEDVLVDARGGRRPLAEDQRWQAALWRALLADVAGTSGLAHAGRAAVHAAFLEKAGRWQGERPAGLPRRILVFGISSLPRQSLEVLAGLARWSQVLMCVHNPCEHYWADIVTDKDLLRAGVSRQRRREGVPQVLSEDQLHLHAHPLLAAWGKQGRDFIALLDEQDSAEARQDYAAYFRELGERIDLFEPRPGATLLQQLQDDIRDLRPLAETRRIWDPVDPRRDGSIRFHVAHGPQREVEILHDQLLAAFDADPGLRPRDVIVMVPDINAYAPHIQAVFGLLDPQDARYIPFSLADQGRRQFDPLVHAVELLVGLPQSRVAVSDLLDLLEVPALRRRFGIADGDLPLLHRWIRGAGIRWGLHDKQRASLGLPRTGEAAAQNSWLFGLRRMLLGYAAGFEANAWQGIEPYAEVGGLEAAALGPLLRLVDKLDETWRALRTPAGVDTWCTRLRALLAGFFATEEGGEAYTLMQLEAALAQWQEASAEAGLVEPLPLSVVGEQWLARLDEGGLSQRFFAGAVTFATLMPMRAIPFRHVCLLGMNDGDYPRTRVPMDFDLMGRDYRPGDRSRREDDRYLFLEALLSARDCLYVSWVGRSITDNTERPPSVLVGQLRDHIRAGWRLAGEAAGQDEAGAALLEALTIEHPLQPFSPAYFAPQPEGSALFTYAREWRPQASGSRGEPSAEAALPRLVREEPLSLRELVEFLKEPARAFFRQRLHVAFELEDPTSEDVEPFQLDGLGVWQLRDELIRAQREALERGEDIAEARTAALARIRRRGELAPGGFGEAKARELEEPMEPLFERYREALARWPRACEAEEVRFRAAIGEGAVELADWLGDIRDDGAGMRARILLETSSLVSERKYRGDRLVRPWVEHLAAHVTGGPLTTVVISPAGEVELQPLAREEAEARLTELLAAWDEGMRRPLPLAVKTALAWLNGGATAARKEYEGDGFKQKGEVDRSDYLRRLWPRFDQLTEGGGFQRLADHLLGPLQQAVHVKAEGKGKEQDQ